MLALVVVALSVGLDNFGAATAMGAAGVGGAMRLRLAVVFGVFEGVMPVIGLLAGRSLSHGLGSVAPVVGGVLLGLAGAAIVADDVLGWEKARIGTSVTAVVTMGAVLSLDNLVVGFALGTYHVAILLAAVVIAVISVALTLAGLELGARLRTRVGRGSELLAAAMLVAVGVAVGTGTL